MSATRCALAQRIDFIREAGLENSYDTILPVSDLPRLGAACADLLGPASFKARFYRDTHGISIMAGSISAEVTLVCERCLKPFALTLKADFACTTESKKAADYHQEDKLDVLEPDGDGLFDLYAYLEDTLLLELPQNPMHGADDECGRSEGSWSFGAESGPGGEVNSLAAQLGSIKDALKLKQ